MFANKTLTIIGGTGYVGSALARKAVSLGIKVNAISRKGKPINQNLIDSKINWIKGSAMNPSEYLDILKSSNAIVHSVGVLIDSAMRGQAKPGENGTFEQMNRDTAISIANAIDIPENKAKIIYISANKSPPQLHRYIKAKREAEEYLLRLKHAKTVVLRPGFIYSSREKIWSIPLKYGIQIGNVGFNLFKNIFPESSIKNYLLKYENDEPISLDNVINSIISVSFNDKYDGKILYGNDMEKLSKELNELNK